MIPSEERRFNLREYGRMEPCVVEFLMAVRRNCWYNGGIHYRAWHMIAETASGSGLLMAEILDMTDREWIWRPNCGRKTLSVIKELLATAVQKSPASIMMECETV